MDSPTLPGHLRGVLAAAAARRRDGVDRVALLVVATHGSTYRKPGALALVDADGAAVGALSGGCLEAQLIEAARAVLDAGRALRLVLDTQDDGDVLFGSGSGCRGRMEVLLLPQRLAEDPDLFAQLELAHEAGAPARLALRGDAWRLLDPNESPHADEALLAIAAPPGVLLFGAGPEAAPLAQALRALGCRVAIADHRPALLTAARLPAADRLVLARPAAALAQLADWPIAAAIVMTHQASADREALAALAPRAIGYVGLLGPRARRAELVAQLDASMRDALAPRLHGPAGLDLGGEGPEAIALSVAAALLQHFAAAHRA